MRQQYHFQPSPEGDKDAWDVHRLIELSADFEPKEIDLPTHYLDEVYWFDSSETNRATVRNVIIHAQLINQADLQYPIILGADGRVMDGMHRIAKAHMQGRTTIAAVQFETDPAPDYRNVTADQLPYD